ncbi:MAG: AI-2E family transporter [Balneolaceae bacterium]
MFKNLTLEKIIKSVLGVSLIVLIAIVLYNYLNLAVYAVLAMLISYMLDPVVNRMQAAGMNRTLASAITLATLILIIVWGSTTVIPIVANQMASLARQLDIDNLRFIAEQVEASIIGNFDFVPQGFLRNNISLLSENLFDVGRLSDVVGDLFGIFTNLFTAFLIIPFAIFFFLKDGHKIRRDLLQLVPNKYFETTLSLIDKVETRLGVYFRSVFVQCTLVGIISWLALSVAGLNNSASVGITIGLANSIPYFGPIIGYILSIVIAIIETGDFTLVIPCIIAVLVAQVVDNIILQPLLFSRSADMHPVAILFIIMIGAQTAGLLGMLIAIPIATVIKISINQIIWSFNNYQVFRLDSSGNYPPVNDPGQSSPPSVNQSE